MLLVMAMAASIAGGVHPHFSETGGSLPQTPAPSVVTLQDAIGRARMRSPLVEGARERERAASLARAVVPRTPNPLFELRGEQAGLVKRYYFLPPALVLICFKIIRIAVGGSKIF